MWKKNPMSYAMCRVPTGITFWDSKQTFKISVLEKFDAAFEKKIGHFIYLCFNFSQQIGDVWRQCHRQHSIKMTTWSSCLPDLLTFPCFVQDSWYLPWTESIAYIWCSRTWSHTTWDYEQKTWRINTKSLHVLNGAWINVGWRQTSHHQRKGSI